MIYSNNPKFKDRKVGAHSVDPGQTAPEGRGTQCRPGQTAPEGRGTQCRPGSDCS